LKRCALRLWGVGWGVEDIYFALGVSSSSCYRWRRLFEQHGQVKRPMSPLIGRTRILTRALLAVVDDPYLEDCDLFLDEACTWLAVEHDMDISPLTVSRNLNEIGLSHNILQKLAAERNEVFRTEFRMALHSDFIGDGSEFVFIYETGKDEHTYTRRRGRAMRGTCTPLWDVFRRGDRCSLCAALAVDGYLASRIILGSWSVITR
ncbi:hypothetical protein EDD16DRAFT_1469232, partial [Pisolithus croceorrhizus]